MTFSLEVLLGNKVLARGFAQKRGSRSRFFLKTRLSFEVLPDIIFIVGQICDTASTTISSILQMVAERLEDMCGILL